MLPDKYFSLDRGFEPKAKVASAFFFQVDKVIWADLLPRLNLEPSAILLRFSALSGYSLLLVVC